MPFYSHSHSLPPKRFSSSIWCCATFKWSWMTLLHYSSRIKYYLLTLIYSTSISNTHISLFLHYPNKTTTRLLLSLYSNGSPALCTSEALFLRCIIPDDSFERPASWRSLLSCSATCFYAPVGLVRLSPTQIHLILCCLPRLAFVREIFY